MRLFKNKTYEEIKVGDTIADFRETLHTIKAIHEPGTSQGGHGGRIETTMGRWFPSMFDAHFEDVIHDVDCRYEPGKMKQQDAKSKAAGEKDNE